jgi:hypothetical protein
MQDVKAREVDVGARDNQANAILDELCLDRKGAAPLSPRPSPFGRLIAEETEKWARVGRVTGSGGAALQHLFSARLRSLQQKLRLSSGRQCFIAIARRVGFGVRVVVAGSFWGVQKMISRIIAGVLVAILLAGMPGPAKAQSLFGWLFAQRIPREVVPFPGSYAPGTIVISTSQRRLYLVMAGHQALR